MNRLARSRWLWLALTLALALPLATACKQGDADPRTQVAPAEIPRPPSIGEKPGAWVLRYFSPTSGQLLTARTPAEVPEGARTQVLVTYEDPKLQGPWLYVADLTQAKDGAYAVQAVSREEVEAQHAPPPTAAASAGPPEQAAQADHGSPASPPGAAVGRPPGPGAADQEVIIYRTSWCGYCKKAAEYLTLKRIPFVEKDLERDPGARQDMLARAQRAGVPAQRLQGVPILWVRGTLIPGFDRGAIDRALGVAATAGP